MTGMNKVLIPSSTTSVAMSTKSTCNKENIHAKKYVSTSDDVDVIEHTQCQSPMPGVDIPTQELNKCDESGENETVNIEKQKFVEAPLPKINPWKSNVNAAHIVRQKDSAKEKDPIVGEKRVLQPQQQTVCEYFYNIITIYC